MSVDGTWTLTMDTPMGERRSTITLKSDGAALTGTQEAEGNKTDIFEGSVNGNEASWKVAITKSRTVNFIANHNLEVRMERFPHGEDIPLQ